MSATQGIITETDDSVPGLTTYNDRGWYQEQQSYVLGGISFVYPVGLFSAPPTVTIGIELSGLAYLTTILCSPFITSNTAASTTVRVNILSGVVVEAGTGDVIVHLRAI